MRALSVAIEAALTGGDILESYFGGICLPLTLG